RPLDVLLRNAVANSTTSRTHATAAHTMTGRASAGNRILGRWAFGLNRSSSRPAPLAVVASLIGIRVNAATRGAI
ncbi:MAG TPA: hypothetical protein PK620_15675, partial [Denitromonas sp.]|nr:hypothetical protein [Denitromonas sp.]